MKVRSIAVFLRRPAALNVLILLLTALLITSPETPAQQQRTHTSQSPTLNQNGFFYGEDQYYVVTPPVIEVYYPTEPHGDSGARKSPTESPKEKYHHETFRLVRGKWAIGRRSFSKKPDIYLSLDSCDTKNEINIPGGELAQALPQSIKIKAIESHLGYAVVIYSDTPDRNEFYALRTALLVRDPVRWRLGNIISSGDAVNFCGLTSFGPRLAHDKGPLSLLVYLGEIDSSGAYFVSIQSFLAREMSDRQQQQNR